MPAGLNAAAPRYRLQIDDDSNFGRPDTFITQATSFSLSKKKRLLYNKLEDGTWYWRVAVLDADGNVGAYSPVQQFTKEYLRPTLVSPVQGAAITGMPEFEWEPLPGAAYYKIRIAQDENSIDTAREVQYRQYSLHADHEHVPGRVLLACTNV